LGPNRATTRPGFLPKNILLVPITGAAHQNPFMHVRYVTRPQGTVGGPSADVVAIYIN
jgi:hypothetical protein